MDAELKIGDSVLIDNDETGRIVECPVNLPLNYFWIYAAGAKEPRVVEGERLTRLVPVPPRTEVVAEAIKQHPNIFITEDLEGGTVIWNEEKNVFAHRELLDDDVIGFKVQTILESENFDEVFSSFREAAISVEKDHNRQLSKDGE